MKGTNLTDASSLPATTAADLQSPPVQTAATGLSQQEAALRLQQHGFNELEKKRSRPLLKFLSYFWGPIPWMIEAAAVLSALVKHWADFVIVLVLLVMNGLVAFWEEFQAGNAVAALQANLALRARVKRDGAWLQIAARELVPGDLIRLRLGDIVPADAELRGDDPVMVDQSALTGESLPIAHESGETIYSGSIIREGETDAQVIATGRDTYFGQTAKLVDTAHNVSHFQRAVLRIGNYLIVIALALVILILGVALLRGDSLLTTLEFALVLTIAAVPVAMPAVLSVTMAVGARKLAKKQAIVTRLAAIEELAGIDILCSDKTGTLTKNSLTISEPFHIDAHSASEVILAAALASRAEDQDAIDSAVLSALPDQVSLQDYEVIHFVPFDPVHKRSEAEVRDHEGHSFRVAKGAPQVVLEMADNAAQIRAEVERAVEEFAVRGFRSLGVARTDAAGLWQFLGVIPLYDPPREDTATTIKRAQELGVKVKMVTGDQLAIAREIARQIGLSDKLQDARLLPESDDEMSAAALRQLDEFDGFAQVFPEHKYRIVEALQKRGHIVGMTGDGVNDAPALKKADAGIAVSGATDAARAAADMVLLSPGLSVIIDAIRLSRRIFRRMTSYAIYRIAETIRVLLFMTLSIIAFNFYPVTALMIVLLALLNDGPILSIAFDRAPSARRPVAWHMQEVLGMATLLGITGVLASFGLFLLGKMVFHLDQATLQSLMFLKLAVAGHLTIFVTRTRGPFWRSRPSGALFWTALSTKLLATGLAVYGLLMTPLGWKWALVVWGYSLAWLFLNDWIKLAGYRLLKYWQARVVEPTAQIARI
ncbi:MAG: plasma-membrane proton-efflux P-type ATPase [bacterium]